MKEFRKGRKLVGNFREEGCRIFMKSSFVDGTEGIDWRVRKEEEVLKSWLNSQGTGGREVDFLSRLFERESGIWKE
jgi:hypothetical protein